MSGPQPGTPTPWVVEEGHIQRDSNGIRYWQITDGQDAIACNQFCYAGYDPAVNAANAAAIVHRVNNWDALEAERDALQARVAALVEALQDVVDPLGKLRRDAEAEGRQLNGWAYQIANDLAFVKDIARAALAGVQ